MGIANFIFGKESARTQLGSLVIDATPSIVTSRNATVTEAPVENGADVSDHARVGPLSLSLDCFISESPTDEMQSFLASVGNSALSGLGSQLGAATKIGGASLIGTGLGAVVGSRVGSKLAAEWFAEGAARDENYPRLAFETLLDIQASFQPFTVQTFFFKNQKDSIYKNMIITGITLTQEARDGKSIRFQVQLRDIRIAELLLADVSGQYKKGEHAANSGEKKTARGQQATKQADPKTTDRGTTALSRLTGIGG